VSDPRRRPRRFRRRLTAAFVLVATISAGTLALVTYGATSSYRWRNFQQMTNDEVRVALALAPETLNQSTFERLLTAYEKRSGTDAIAISPDGETFTSSVTLSQADVPLGALDGNPAELVTTEVERENGRSLVVAGPGPNGAKYVFFFSLEQLESSLAELRIVLLVAWMVVAGVAAAVGELIARRTLRPVRDAGEAATALAGGLLDTRLPAAGDDEFGAWAESFNRMADALEAKIDELGRAADRERQFTSDVAHDLRTPLTGMAVRASLLLEEANQMPAPAREAVAALAEDVARLKNLVLELLELSRLDAGSAPPSPETFAVAPAVKSTVESLRLLAPDQVSVAIDPALEVRTGRFAFRRIVGNLISNAVTHGGGEVIVRAHQVASDVIIDVCDRGPGVDPDAREQIFHRFFKSDDSRAHGGSGLGLSIAREHARSQGGDVRVTDAPDGGACFRISLPAPPPSGSDAWSHEPSDDRAPPPPSRFDAGTPDRRSSASS
jgi:two-component system sensor histidine kinase MtrB